MSRIKSWWETLILLGFLALSVGVLIFYPVLFRIFVRPVAVVTTPISLQEYRKRKEARDA